MHALVDRLDMLISETESIVEIAIAIAEMDDAERARLRPAAIAVLYLAGERLRLANRALGRLDQARRHGAPDIRP